MIALSSFLCTIVVHIYQRVSEQHLAVPRLFKIIFFDVLGKIYCILPTNVEFQRKNTIIEVEKPSESENIENFFKSCRQNTIKSGFDKLQKNDKTTEMIMKELECLINLEKIVKEIGDYIYDTRKKIELKENKTKIAKDWKLIALIIDRTCFYVFLIVTIITIIIISIDVWIKN